MIRLLFICAALFTFYVPARAQECPATQLNDAKKMITDTKTCDAAVLLFENCGAKASSYLNLYTLAVAAQQKCEKEFLDDLHGKVRVSYKKLDHRCYKKDTKAPIFYAPKMMCQPYMAQSYGRMVAKAKAELAKNPNPPL